MANIEIPEKQNVRIEKDFLLMLIMGFKLYVQLKTSQ
jgi:hypothetical protein